MLKFLFILPLFASFSSPYAFAQEGAKPSKIIEVPFDKRVTLIFPSTITEDVLGSDQVDPVKKDNKYFITALSQKGFPETSLYIELASGHYYDFIVKFNNTIKNAVTVFTLEEATGKINMANGSAATVGLPLPAVNLKGKSNKEKETIAPPSGVAQGLYSDAKTVFEKPEHITDIAVVGRKLQFYLEEIYIREDKMFFKISMKNLSNVTYDIHSIDFKIQPKHALLKKNATEFQEVKPIFVYNEDKMQIDPKKKLSKVFTFDKFTISDKKKFVVEIWEKGGDRELYFDISGDDLLNAKPLN